MRRSVWTLLCGLACMRLLGATPTLAQAVDLEPLEKELAEDGYKLRSVLDATGHYYALLVDPVSQPPRFAVVRLVADTLVWLHSSDRTPLPHQVDWLVLGQGAYGLAVSRSDPELSIARTDVYLLSGDTLITTYADPPWRCVLAEAVDIDGDGVVELISYQDEAIPVLACSEDIAIEPLEHIGAPLLGLPS